MSACCSLIYIFCLVRSLSLTHSCSWNVVSMFLMRVLLLCTFVLIFGLIALNFVAWGFINCTLWRKKKIRAKADIFPEEWKKTHIGHAPFSNIHRAGNMLLQLVNSKTDTNILLAFSLIRFWLMMLIMILLFFFLLPASAASIHFECDFIERQTQRERERAKYKNHSISLGNMLNLEFVWWIIN